MKLLKITTCYPSYVRDFYRKRPGLAVKTFAEQKVALDYDAFGWADYWSHALMPLGYDVLEITMNVEPLQRAWAQENSLPNPQAVDLKEIVFEQVKRFKPEVLWFDDLDAELLKRIREEVQSIRLVLGWVGSAIPRSNVWQYMDLVLSCAPESVTCLQRAGFRAVQLHHGFDPRINDRLKDQGKKRVITFVGQLMRGSQFHLYREQLLEELAEQADIEIYSPSADFGWKEEIMALSMTGAYYAVQGMESCGVPESVLRALPLLRKALQLSSRPIRPVDPKLKPFLKPAVFGLEMFQVLRDSEVSLNIHADSSPMFASNMRLFETTGVGTCMVTDWKENLAELFEPDKEVVVYKTIDECVEKVGWLLEHPRQCEEIARAGMTRTLKDYTFTQRALRLDEIIKKELMSR